MDDQEHTYSPVFDVELNAIQILKYAFFSLLVALVSDISSTQGSLYLVARGIIVCLLLISIFSPVRFGIVIFFILLVGGLDIVQGVSEALEFGRITKATIWNLRIGFIQPSWIVAAVCLVHIVKIGPLKIDKNVKYAVAWFAIVPVLTGFLYGGIEASPISRRVVISDIKMGMMLLVSIILFRSFLAKNPQFLATLVAVFIGCLLGRHFIDLVYWVLEKGALLSGIVRVSVDSTKGTVIFLLLYSIYLVFVRKKFLIGPIIGISSCLLLITFGSRGFWVTGFLGCVILLWIFGIKRGLLALPFVVLVVMVSIMLLQKLRPMTAYVISKKAESLVTTKRTGNILMRIDPLRYSATLNSLHTSFKRGSLLFGNGYGSYYRDDLIPFPRELTDAFPEHSAATGKFYRIHNFFPHTLFKHGLVGLIIITALYMVPSWRCYQILRHNPTLMSGALACFIAFFVTVIVQFYWSGKGAFISGFIIAVLYSFAEQYNQAQVYLLDGEQYGTFDVESS